MSKPDRNWPGVYATLPSFAPCPGYKRACGVSTPRRLCRFCQRTKDLEREKR